VLVCQLGLPPVEGAPRLDGDAALPFEPFCPWARTS